MLLDDLRIWTNVGSWKLVGSFVRSRDESSSLGCGLGFGSEPSPSRGCGLGFGSKQRKTGVSARFAVTP